MEHCSQTERIAVIEQKIETMVESVNKMASAVSGLVRFETEMKAIDDYRAKHGNKNLKLIGVVISLSSLLIASITVIITILRYK